MAHTALASWSSNGRTTFRVGLALFAALIVYFWFQSDTRTGLHLCAGLVQVILAAVPSLLWLKRESRTLPIFEVLMLAGISTYALPLLGGHEATAHYSDDEIGLSAMAVIAFQGAALICYEFSSARPRTTRFWRDELISEQVSRGIIHGMTLSTVYALTSTFTDLLPSSGAGIVRAVFFGLGIVSTFLTARRLGANELGQGERLLFFGNLLVHSVATMATLFLVSTVSLLLLALIGYVSRSRILPLFTAVSLAAVLALLHNGKSEMRERYWDAEERRVPTIGELPEFYSQWLSAGLRANRDDNNAVLTAGLVDRTSLFQIICLVVSASPDPLPYLAGDTYRDVPAQFVPRIFWPEKPGAHVSTARLCVYYGLQSEEDTAKTTIGFGMPAEAYANFGIVGIVTLGAFLGFSIKLLQCWGTGCPLLSAGGLLLVILLAWSFQTEFTLSMWLTSLFQACVAVIGSLLLFRLVRAQ